MTLPHHRFRILATFCCVIGASTGAPDGFATSMLLVLAACSSVLALCAGHADPSPVVAGAHRPIEVTR
jgi:hypothetical protein